MHGGSNGDTIASGSGSKKAGQQTNGTGNTANKLTTAMGTATSSSAKREEMQLERITRESLKTMKSFQKLLKRQSKEKEALKKKHNKERAMMQKQHAAIIDKMNANNSKKNGRYSAGAGGGVSSVSTSVYVNSSNLNSTNANSSVTLVNGQVAASGSGSNNTNNTFLFSDAIASAADNNESSFKAKVLGIFHSSILNLDS